jgi:hypothetical protein
MDFSYANCQFAITLTDDARMVERSKHLRPALDAQQESVMGGELLQNGVGCSLPG